MASSFDRWEKDPFFSVAEEVQESADRMESTYRTWLHSVKDPSSILNSNEVRRDLLTALGTTKWQLEEFGRAAGSTYVSKSEDARDRHREFTIAIENQISTIEKSLQESAALEGKASVPWVRLDKGERDELALFLSGSPPLPPSRNNVKIAKGEEMLNMKEVGRISTVELANNLDRPIKWDLSESKEDCKSIKGHRRTASAGADFGAWKIAVAEDLLLGSSSSGQPERTPCKIPSVSGFLNTMEFASRLKWSKNGFRKLKVVDHHQEGGSALGINNCYEGSKSCLNGCDECCDKQFHGWYGAVQRQLQRSQYQVQYGRPIQVTFWFAVLLCLIVMFALRAI